MARDIPEASKGSESSRNDSISVAVVEDSTTSKKDETKSQPKPSLSTEGTDVAAPASASIIPNDSPAQTGATMGEHCVTDRPTPSGEEPTGEISKIAEIDVYISKPADYPQKPSKLLLLLSSGTGIHSKNNQIQADHFAKEDFLVVMPDQFGGDPAPNAATKSPTEPDDSILEQIKLRAVDTVQSFKIDMWLARQTPEKILPLLQKFLKGAKEEFADAVANGGGIYVVGYCIGAKYALLLSSDLSDTEAHGQPEETEPGVVEKKSDVKAVAIAHGTMINAADFEKVKAPITIVSVENDPLFPDDIQEAGIQHLKTNAIKHEQETYKDVQHGFAVVGEYPDAKVQNAQEKAFKQIVDWLKGH